MALSTLFKVGTEFRFEVGSALLGMKGLQDQVEKVSSAADQTLVSFQKLGAAAVVNLGFGSGSLLGLLTKAVQTSEMVNDAQLKLSTIMFANRDKFIGPVETFNDRMLVSEKILKRIAKDAKEFSLPEKPLKDLTALLGAQLAGKGLLGKDFENAIRLSRDFLKATPLLGVDAGLATGQLQDLISGNAVKGRLFERLTAETSAFQPFQKGGTKAFNALPAAKRLEVLSKGLRQFTSATAEVQARTRTLTSSMQRLKNILSGLDGIIKPLGDAVRVPIVNLINNVSEIMDKEFRVVFANLAKIIKPLVSDVRGLTINLLQLRRAIDDVRAASTALVFVGLASFLLKLAFIRKALLFVGISLGRVIGFVTPFIFNLRNLALIFKVVSFSARTFLAPMALLFGVFQIISRAIAIAKVRDLEALPAILAKFSELAARAFRALRAIFGPFIEIIDFIAQKIAFLFQKSTLLKIAFPVLEGFVTILEGIATVAVLARAGLQGLFFALFQFIDNISSGKILSAFEGTGAAFNAGVNDILDKNRENLFGETAPTVNQVTNISGGIKIVNQFKENLEPDRIAFALNEQLKRTAQNPTQARGRTFSRAGAL